jgi:hypothetical protein
VYVLEHYHDGPLLGDRFEQPAKRPRGLLGVCRARGGADRSHHPLYDELGVIGGSERIGKALGPAQREDDLPERPERDAFPVRKAAPLEDGRGGAGRELRDEARLADSGRPEHGEEAAALLCLDAPKGQLQGGKLFQASDESPMVDRATPAA